jgi:hypothetical protein
MWCNQTQFLFWNFSHKNLTIIKVSLTTAKILEAIFWSSIVGLFFYFTVKQDIPYGDIYGIVTERDEKYR